MQTKVAVKHISFSNSSMRTTLSLGVGGSSFPIAEGLFPDMSWGVQSLQTFGLSSCTMYPGLLQWESISTTFSGHEMSTLGTLKEKGIWYRWWEGSKLAAKGALGGQNWGTVQGARPLCWWGGWNQMECFCLRPAYMAALFEKVLLRASSRCLLILPCIPTQAFHYF